MRRHAALILSVLLLLLAGAGRAASADPLEPLYRRAAADLRRGQPLVATVHVALCDNSIIWCGGRGLGNGDAPARNLYWGGAAGLRAFFDRARGFRRIHLDRGDGKTILERVVYRLRVVPSARWRRLGVRRPFDLLLVGLAYRGTRIGVASDTFIRQVAGEVGDTLRLADGRTLSIGGSGHLVGYAGHNHLMDAFDYRFPARTRRRPLAYLALSCRNASYLMPALYPAADGQGARAVLLTRTLMYPGTFTVAGVLRGIAAGETQHRVYLRGVEQYATFQKRPRRAIRAAFIHDGEARFRRRYGPAAVRAASH